MKALRGDYIQFVYDITIAYRYKTDSSFFFGKYPSLARINMGPLTEYECHLHVQRFAVTSLPEDPKELSQWLLERFEQKDQLLECMSDKWTAPFKLLDQPWQVSTVYQN